ncbi:peptidylprolyl isomerase [Parvularcula marina]|uniref:Parvulin-like PPIase n=1 Tax=Parvularcula marina TaxID=2292771 RepID=A0A371RKY6_9PROT|nr:peptidylprolyl isomerase [Parvularcula marina]RFB06104.1 hypothetical protein DX908_13010 [Parvularcula marina]
MKKRPSIWTRSGVGPVLGYCGLITHRAVGSVGLRDLVLGAGAMALVLTAAEKAVDGPLAAPAPNPVLEARDPVLIAVGTTPIRLSDARAQAVISQVSDAEELPAPDLFQTGLVGEAADQVALAKLAEARGLEDALEVRAQLALARRRILSSALLDLAVNREVTEDQVRAVYDAEVAAAAADQTLILRRIQVSSMTEAEDILTRLGNGASFSEMARRRSLDMSTRNQGGDLGKVRLSDLPPSIADVLYDLPVGDVSIPVEGQEGWYLLTVDARSEVRLPPFEDVQENIERRLRDEVVTKTIAEARAAVPIRMAGNGLDAGPLPLMSLQSAGRTW